LTPPQRRERLTFEIVCRDHEHALSIRVGGDDDLEISPFSRLAEHDARVARAAPALQRPAENVLYFPLTHTMRVDVRKPAAGLNIISYLHVSSPLPGNIPRPK